MPLHKVIEKTNSLSKSDTDLPDLSFLVCISTTKYSNMYSRYEYSSQTRT